MTDIKGVSEYYSVAKNMDYEKIRLEKWSPVEFLITKHFMKEYIPKKDNMKILEVGVGYGHYNGSGKITLLDITPSFLEEARTRLKNANLESSIEDEIEGSALDLEKLCKKDYYDVILFLGPMYHLTMKSERQDCFRQALGCLKTGGLIFVAAINIFAAFRDMVQFSCEDKNFLNKNTEGFFRMLETGVATKDLNLPIGLAYFHRSGQFKEELEEGNEKIMEYVDYIGCEGFTTEKQAKYWNDLSEENKEILFKFLVRSCREPESFGKSDHFLYIGRKL